MKTHLRGSFWGWMVHTTACRGSQGTNPFTKVKNNKQGVTCKSCLKIRIKRYPVN